MASQTVSPARTLEGSLVLPGDKSISHRYAMLAGFASGTSTLENFSTGADPHSTLACMAALGAKVTTEGSRITINGTGGTFHQPAAALDCGNSGSTMRMLAGLVAGQDGLHSELTGDASLNARPMERIRRPLTEMGAAVELTDGHAPVRVVGRPLGAIDFATPIASAQVATAVLFAGLRAEGSTTLTEAIRTRDHTEHALRAFGATLSRTFDRETGTSRVALTGPQPLTGITATVPGDLSSAAFFLCAALLFPDANVVLDGVGLNPTRSALLDVVTMLGAKIRVLNVEEHHGELVGTLQVNTSQPPARSGPLVLEGALTAQLIDELPVLAAIAPYTRDGLILRDAGELRVKESDRIDLVARNLRAMGAQLTEQPDGLTIPGSQQLHGAEIDAGGDHRIAMAFAVAALRASSANEIHGAEAASISFPEFWSHLDELCPR